MFRNYSKAISRKDNMSKTGKVKWRTTGRDREKKRD